MTKAGRVVTLDNPLDEAKRLISLADERGLQVRLMGGLAFHALVPEWNAPVDREGRDIDLATRHADRRGVIDLLGAQGYEGDRRYNAVHGHKQLYYVDIERQRPVDVLIERFEMCHVFEFGDRLGRTGLTLPAAELFLSKVQIARINRKDMVDVLVLLSEVDITTDDAGLNIDRITSITSNDWGWWRTVIGNLDAIRHLIAGGLEPDVLDLGRPPRHSAAVQLDEVRRHIDMAPKSVRWKTRARVGDRMSWYHEPEEIGH